MFKNYVEENYNFESSLNKDDSKNILDRILKNVFAEDQDMEDMEEHHIMMVEDADE